MPPVNLRLCVVCIMTNRYNYDRQSNCDIIIIPDDPSYLPVPLNLFCFGVYCNIMT